ncbi:MAG: dihydroorotate dehydrogenase-like protein [Anaerolineaceae bacterium]
MADLTTTFTGMELKNPLIVGSSPFSKQLDLAKLLEDEGAAAMVMYSLFEEETIHESNELDYFLNRGTESQPEAQTYIPEPQAITSNTERYLEQIRLLKSSLSIPIIASLNGFTPRGWSKLASQIEAEGVDALELNLYTVVTDETINPDRIIDGYVAMVSDVCANTSIPVCVKLSPYFTNLPRFLCLAKDAGADGFVLFNRFLQPDIDIDNERVTLKTRLSSSADLSLAASWIALMSPKLNTDFAACNGVHTAHDIVKAVMAGASAVTMVSELLQHGPKAVSKVLRDLHTWMDVNEFETIGKLKGVMSQNHVKDPLAFERGNYIKALRSYNENVI